MTAVAAPFGAKAVRHDGGGTVQHDAIPGGILSGYATQISYGDFVTLNANGTLQRATPGAAIYGVFCGCDFKATGRFYLGSRIWPASQVATDIVAYVYADPNIEYHMQANATMAATAVGDEANFVQGTPNAQGYSTNAVGTLVGAGNTGDLRIVGIALSPGNAWGDAFPIVRVTINRLAGRYPFAGSTAV